MMKSRLPVRIFSFLSFVVLMTTSLDANVDMSQVRYI